MNKKDLEKIELLKELKAITKKLKDKRIIASVKHVSTSGMTREIGFYYQDKKTGYLYCLNYKISKILGYSLGNNGVRVQGCGMDMIFHCLYNINCIALRYGIVKPSKLKNEHYLRYNGVVNTHYEYL